MVLAGQIILLLFITFVAIQHIRHTGIIAIQRINQQHENNGVTFFFVTALLIILWGVIYASWYVGCNINWF